MWHYVKQFCKVLRKKATTDSRTIVMDTQYVILCPSNATDPHCRRSVHSLMSKDLDLSEQVL